MKLLTKTRRSIPELELVAVNDLMDTDNSAYLLKYDSVYGKYQHDIVVEGDSIKIKVK